MEGYCARCKTSLAELPDEALERGFCPRCGGQISLGSHSGQLGVAGAIGMTFAAGSNIGTPLGAPFDQARLDTTFDENTAVRAMPKLDVDAAADVEGDSTSEAATEGGGAGPAAGSPSLAFDLAALPGAGPAPAAVSDAALPPLFGPVAAEPGALAAAPGVAKPFAFDLPPLFGGGPPAAGTDDTNGAPAWTGPQAPAPPVGLFTAASTEAVGSPTRAGSPEAQSPDAPAIAGTGDDDGVPAHLRLPTFDFSLPPLPAGVAGAVANPAPPAGTEMPAHLQLPTFPQFDLPPIPGEEPGPAAQAYEAGAAAETARGAPPPPPRLPPPPPIRRARARGRPNAAAAELPAIGLPSLGAEPKKKEITLLKAEHAADLAEVPPRKRPVLPFLAVILLIAGVTAALLKLDTIVALVTASDAPKAVVESPEDKALALYASGQEAYGKNRLEEAVKRFEAALKALPTFAKAHRALGIARAKQNRAADAVEHYRQYLALDPKAADAADVRKIIDDYEKAKSSGAVKAGDAKARRKRP